MPEAEFKKQVSIRMTKNHLTLDDVLIIAEYFGVSFSACYYRMINLISTPFAEKISKRTLKNYHPDLKRKQLGFDDSKLLSDLFDVWDDIDFDYSDKHARRMFKSNYIYNDARLEGVCLQQEEVGEIVADLRANTQKSQYCNPAYEVFCHVAGHAAMYEKIFELTNDQSCSIFLLGMLNSLLFSCFPNPEYGGVTRKNNTLVLGAKFETIDFRDIATELLRLETVLSKLIADACAISRSEYIRRVIGIHHRITVIHPYSDGNGRTSRAFMNLLFILQGIPPIYFCVRVKDEYCDALSYMDTNADSSVLLSLVFKTIMFSHAELHNQGSY